MLSGLTLKKQGNTSSDITTLIKENAVYGLAAIGLLYTGKKAMYPLREVYKHYLRPRKDLVANYSGNWAVVTGASGGIGEQICMQLAKSGYNIVLVADKKSELLETAKKIKTEYGKETRVLPFNFNVLATEEGVDNLNSLLDTVTEDVSMLVNNVGITHNNHFEKHTPEVMNALVNINIRSQLFMSHYFIPKFQERFNGEQKRSAIVDIASMGAFGSNLYESVYVATKAFNRVLSVSQATEYGDMIDYLTVTPAFTATHLCPDLYMFTVTAESEAETIVNAIGYEKETIGHIKHKVYYHLRDKPITGPLISYINKSRKLQWIKERDQKQMVLAERQFRQDVVYVR